MSHGSHAIICRISVDAQNITGHIEVHRSWPDVERTHGIRVSQKTRGPHSARPAPLAAWLLQTVKHRLDRLKEIALAALVMVALGCARLDPLGAFGQAQGEV